MPILTVNDPVPSGRRRIVVAGTSGAGKTTVAARIAVALQVPHVEIDGLFHGPGWSERPTFMADVERFSAAPQWVTEWQYPAARGLLAQRADLMVWLDLPRAVVMRQVIVRTVRRRLRREKLWGSNVEPAFRTFFTDPEHIVRWAWITHRESADRIVGVSAQRPDLPIVRLGSRREVERWLRDLTH